MDITWVCAYCGAVIVEHGTTDPALTALRHYNRTPTCPVVPYLLDPGELYDERDWGAA